MSDDRGDQEPLVQLQAFARSLSDTGFVQAAVMPSGSAETYSLVTTPRLRPGTHTFLLTGSFGPSSVRVYDTGETIESRSAFANYLVSFRQKLESALRDYKNMLNDPCTGALQKEYSEIHTPESVLVLVPPESQQRLAEGKPKERLRIEVQLPEAVQLASFEEGADYQYLMSEGLGLMAVSVRRDLQNPSKLMVEGDRLQYAPALEADLGD